MLQNFFDILFWTIERSNDSLKNILHWIDCFTCCTHPIIHNSSILNIESNTIIHYITRNSRPRIYIPHLNLLPRYSGDLVEILKCGLGPVKTIVFIRMHEVNYRSTMRVCSGIDVIMMKSSDTVSKFVINNFSRSHCVIHKC